MTHVVLQLTSAPWPLVEGFFLVRIRFAFVEFPCNLWGCLPAINVHYVFGDCLSFLPCIGQCDYWRESGYKIYRWNLGVQASQNLGSGDK